MLGKVIDFKGATNPALLTKKRGPNKSIAKEFRLACSMGRRQSIFMVKDSAGLRRGICIGAPFSQTISALIAAGGRGVTAWDTMSWAVGSLSDHIDLLRGEFGLKIKTVREEDGCLRHILKSEVRRLTMFGDVA